MAIQLTKDAWRFLIDESLKEIRSDVDKDMPLPALMIFLRIPETGAISVTQLKAGLKELSHGAVSRSVSLLTGQSKIRKDKGLDICEAYDDPEDRRHRMVKLSPEGRKVREKIYLRISEKFERFYNRSKKDS